MSFHLTFTQSYLKKAEQFSKNNPELKKQYLRLLQLLELNPYHQAIRLHKLHGKVDMLHSVSIDLSYRITIELFIKGHEITPVNIGTHEELYI